MKKRTPNNKISKTFILLQNISLQIIKFSIDRIVMKYFNVSPKYNDLMFVQRLFSFFLFRIILWKHFFITVYNSKLLCIKAFTMNCYYFHGDRFYDNWTIMCHKRPTIQTSLPLITFKITFRFGFDGFPIMQVVGTLFKTVIMQLFNEIVPKRFSTLLQWLNPTTYWILYGLSSFVLYYEFELIIGWRS